MVRQNEFTSEPETEPPEPGFGGNYGRIVVQDIAHQAGILNMSGYTCNTDKLMAQPAGWKEVAGVGSQTNGYREDWEEDSNTAVRVFNGPWGTRKAFIDWALGFAWND